MKKVKVRCKWYLAKIDDEFRMVYFRHHESGMSYDAEALLPNHECIEEREPRDCALGYTTNHYAIVEQVDSNISMARIRTSRGRVFNVWASDVSELEKDLNR